MQTPLVSICIPTYNGAKYIAEAMDSAINQTYSNLEIIVSDDASKDATLAIIESYRSKTDIPISIYNHTPSGIGANWNHCVRKAKGDYIKFLFQDDVLLPECIEKQVKVLEKDTTIGLVACKRSFIIDKMYKTPKIDQWIEQFGDLQKNFPMLQMETGVLFTNKHFKDERFFQSPLNKVGEPPTTLFSKQVWQEIGEFREDLKQILDYEFYYRILLTKKIFVLEEALIKFRLHENQATNVNRGNDGEDYLVYEQLKYTHYFKFLTKKSKLN